MSDSDDDATGGGIGARARRSSSLMKLPYPGRASRYDELRNEASQRAYAQDQKQWKVIKAERKLRRFMQSQTQRLKQNSDSGYVLNADLFGQGSSAAADEVGGFSHLPAHVKCHKHYADISRKAERDLGSLTAVERFAFFYAFTKSGFRESVKIGRLPDGSDLKRVGDGKFKDKYGIVRDEHGPFWPNDVGPMFAPPTLSRVQPAKPELVLEHSSGKCRHF